MAKKRIVVTGVSGQLGSELESLWRDAGHFDVVYLRREDLDLANPESISSRLANYAPDYIVHAAAYTAVDKAESEPELADAVNHLSAVEIAKYAAQHGAKLVSISTDYVFAGDQDFPLDEQQDTAPINVYGETKRQGELGILNVCPEAIIIRTSWVYSTFGKNFVKTMLHLMTTRDEISVVSDQIGSPTYARDLAVLIDHIIDKGPWIGGIYHYSNEGQCSWHEFAIAIRDLSGLTCQVHAIPTSAFPTAAKRPHYSLLSKEKIKETFHVAVPQWKDSLKEMLLKLEKNI
ncbi:dTDP-4-dehydrorhamnose reductase [Sphingobacterium lactis]|uniref:dTDP-4-dehydrorhamnose reductase n=1 Tax=Sphingobacterium lactis TaxID=797291 RepID=A0A1H5VRQ3_9SPHI|nr:dTDP-4-dehydrorhamnose reductase [Sphingobacterium lactis]SEF89696.1 dTDP-4-dehydrorhamnose reductase [Sphingobacterium lactis]